MQYETGLFRKFLEKRGLRVTQTRMQIAETVFSTHKHFTPDELAEWVRKKDSSTGRMTVYRTLGLLVESELVEELTLRKGQNLYEHVVGHKHHHHMICLRCGRIQEFSNEALESLPRQVARQKGFTATSHAIKIHGFCKACSPIANGHRGGGEGETVGVASSRAQVGSGEPSET
ncbi:MAG: transcriptional repressor [Planctomycetes bacterium]|nr:transcriptional repressor [Planctomycetota bacterium]